MHGKSVKWPVDTLFSRHSKSIIIVKYRFRINSYIFCSSLLIIMIILKISYEHKSDYYFFPERARNKKNSSIQMGFEPKTS